MNTSTPRASESSRGTLLVIVASMLWGTSGIASQAAATLTATNPLSLSFLRLMIAAPILLLSGWHTLQSAASDLYRIQCWRDLVVYRVAGNRLCQPLLVAGMVAHSVHGHFPDGAGLRVVSGRDAYHVRARRQHSGIARTAHRITS